MPEVLEKPASDKFKTITIPVSELENPDTEDVENGYARLEVHESWLELRKFIEEFETYREMLMKKEDKMEKISILVDLDYLYNNQIEPRLAIAKKVRQEEKLSRDQENFIDPIIKKAHASEIFVAVAKLTLLVEKEDFGHYEHEAEDYEPQLF